MLKSRSREVQIWWPLPLAALLWVTIIWGFGFFLTSPKLEIKSPPLVEASFVELTEEKPQEKTRPAAPKSTPVPPPPKSRPQPKLRPPPKIQEKREAAKPTPKRSIAKGETRSDRPVIPKPTPDLEPKAEQPKDLLAYMKEAQERRKAGGIFEDEPAQPQTIEREPSEEELRMANVMRNLREPGASGIFQIIRMGPRSAEFLFRAWKQGSSVPRRELVQVHAAPGEDIERAVVRKMIELIRQYHKGDFNWESYRLDRVVVLSARLEDSKGLEDFLIREFFGEAAAPLR
jgi:hypothetical protein